MKKEMVVFCGMMLAASVVQGAEKDGFWDKMQNRLEKVTPAKKTSATTAVGGVRGAKNDDAADIYWKGKDKPVEAPDEELQKFNAGVEAKLKGDNELALKQFDEFIAAYPNSSLRLDSMQAAERIRNEIAAAKRPVKIEPAVVSPAPQPAAAAAPAPAAATTGQPAVAAEQPAPAAPASVPAVAAPQPVAEGDAAPAK
ncbi:MAG: hypothetical protein FIA91_06595 [Geobacter sp.]|nr:hypothetical protein [Geobacter sp.]